MSKGLFLRDMLSQNIDEEIYCKLVTGNVIQGKVTACFSDCLLVEVERKRAKNQAYYIMLSKIVYCYRVSRKKVNEAPN